ncbi:MAG: hypothetical protein ISS33_02235 [Candidatus Omnitrophica bacterium]|nr:hypothetical protein [Candidatus Omnitrophota bacterium]
MNIKKFIHSLFILFVLAAVAPTVTVYGAVTHSRRSVKIPPPPSLSTQNHPMQPISWKLVAAAMGIIMGIMLLMMGLLWVVSLNIRVKLKTRQIQLLSEQMMTKDKLAVLGKLAGQIAHELRTPLSIITNSVFLLRHEGMKDKKLFEKRLNVLEEKIKLTSNILESILSYSRVKADIATTISIKECVEEVLKDMAIPEDIAVEVSFKDEDFLSVFMDFHQLYSVLRNLILNAVDVMNINGTLTVKSFCVKDNSVVKVCVSDTGPGITEADKGQIFNLFYSSKITGTGLGLPIAQSIIETNNGKLYLEKTGTNGSCFALELNSAKKIKK